MNHDNIDLYVDNNSHPRKEASYAAACTFYTMIFGKDPGFITCNGGLRARDAATIRAVVKKIVYDHLHHWVNQPIQSLAENFEAAPLTGTEENATMNASPSIQISPNPAIDDALLTFSNDLANDRLEVFNVLGEKFHVPYQKVSAHQVKMNTHSLQNGMYVVKLSSGTSHVVTKMLVER